MTPEAVPVRHPSAAELAAVIDHTLLRPEATRADLARVCDEALCHGFAAVCIQPVYVADARQRLAGSPVLTATVCGFPHGADHPLDKAAQARRAVDAGAQEIDMVLFVGGLKDREDTLVRDDIAGVAAACHAGGARCKVILETCLLTGDEKARACALCVEAGADYVKTSTGLSAGGATAGDVALLARLVRPRGLGVKAAGGIRTVEDARRMLAAGATRIGTSSGTAMMAELGR